jgi:hypothetical protein
MLAPMLCAASLLPAADDPPRGPAADRPLVIRVHSLAGLVERRGTQEAVLELLPYSVSLAQTPTEVDLNEGQEPLSCDDVASLVRESVEPAFWDENPGARLGIQGSDRLLVAAPQEIQDRIADLLSRLATFALGEALEVRVLEAAADDFEDGELAIDVAEADRRIAKRGLLRHASAALRGRAVVAAESTDLASIVYDWEVEIAQGAIISDPITRGVETGLVLRARSARVSGGTLVSLLVRESERAAPDAERRFQARGLVNAKPVMSERAATGLLQHPRMSFASFAGSLFLPAGRAAWIPVAVDTHLGRASFCLDLRVTGRAGPPRVTIEDVGHGEEKLRLDLLARGHSDLGSLRLSRAPPSLFDPEWTIDGTAPMWAVLGAPEDDDTSVELAHAAAAEPLDSGIGSAGYAGSLLRLSLPPSFSERALAAIAAAQPADASVLLRGRLLAGEKEYGSFRLPVLLGRPLALWSGVQGTQVIDWDVDVANEAQICNPTVEAWVDGFALRLEASRAAGGDLALEANGKLCRLRGPPRVVELEDDARLAVDEIEASTLFLDELRILPARGGRVRLGGNLALELEVLPIGR